jgi:hypothetical protein
LVHLPKFFVGLLFIFNTNFMKKSVVYSIQFLAIVFIILSCNSCEQLKGLQNMTKCEFRLKSIDILSIDNVDVSRVKTINDLDALTITRLGASLLSGKMPLTYRANIEAKNPNSQRAAISKFALHILFNNVDLVQTEVNKNVEVLPAQTTLIPIEMTSDIGQIVKGENIKNVLGLIFPGSDSPAVFIIKLKPSVIVGPVTLNYPGYITLDKNFKSN